jgi:hypothetical protein
MWRQAGVGLRHAENHNIASLSAEEEFILFTRHID